MWLCCGCGLCIGLRLGSGRGGRSLGGLEDPVGWVRGDVVKTVPDVSDRSRPTETYSLTWMPRMVKAVKWRKGVLRCM